MPTNRLPEVIKRLDILEKQMATHLDEGVHIKVSLAKLHTNMRWVKWTALAILGGCISLNFAVGKLLLERMLYKPSAAKVVNP